MGDMGDLFRSYKQDKKIQKKHNKVKNMDALKQFGLEYTVHNNGNHVVITTLHQQPIDFYPSTGKWKKHNNTKRGFGVVSLLNFIESQGGLR